MEMYSESQQVVYNVIYKRIETLLSNDMCYDSVKIFKTPRTIVSIRRAVSINTTQFHITIDTNSNICLDSNCYILNHCWKETSGACYAPTTHCYIITDDTPTSLCQFVMEKIQMDTCRGCDTSVPDNVYCDTCMLEYLMISDCSKCSVCHEYLTVKYSCVSICSDTRHDIHKRCFLQLHDKHHCPLCRRQHFAVPRLWDEDSVASIVNNE
jgi:hypothetical protein